MKRITKLLAVLLAALLIASSFSAAYALETIEIAGYTSKDYGDCGNGVKWYFAQKENEPDTMLITGNGAMNNYSDSNRPQWYRLKEKIRKVKVMEGVTSIGDFAFADCPDLNSVVMDKTVRSIGASAFANCRFLADVQLSSQLTAIGECAFEKCYKLNAVDLPGSLKSLGRYAFFKCENLTSEVVIPKGVSVVPDSAFFNCKNIRSVVLEEGVTAIGNSTFSGCCSLERVELPKSLQSLDNGAFAECINLTRIALPEKVSTIPESAFACTTETGKLAEVSFYNSVRTIKDSAFFGCPIGRVIFYGTSEEWQRIWIEGHNDALSGADKQFTSLPDNAKPAAEQGKACKYCGEVHGDSFGQKIVAFFHRILAFFGLKK